MLEDLVRHRGLELTCVDLHVSTARSLRLDREPHRKRLLETAKRVRPRRLLLDPLARLQGVDQNNARQVQASPRRSTGSWQVQDGLQAPESFGSRGEPQA